MMTMTIAASKFLRPEHGGHEVNQESQRNKPDNKYIHKRVLSEASATFRVSDAEKKKPRGDGDKNDIRHPCSQQKGDYW
jgi:hypothetical protein